MKTANPFASKVMEMAERETHGWKMMIGGKWVEARSSKRAVTFNPAYDQPLAEVPAANAEDVADAVAAAKAAFPAWSRLHVDERAKYLQRFADGIRAWAREFGMLDTLDSGNPLPAMIDDANKGAGLHDYFCGLGMEMKGRTIPTPGGGLNYTRQFPFGVVGRIIPFNHPISFAAGKIAPPLVAGNTVVLKPAEQTPLSAMLLGRLVEEHLPPGVVNIVVGDGPNCGAPLASHRDVRRVAFTGSVEVGRSILASAGIKPVSLELGGKNPLIVFPDVDIEKAAAAAVSGMNFTRSQGQSCGSNSRVFVHAKIHDAFMEAVLTLASKIKVSLPELENAQMGPVVTRRHYDRVMGYIESGRKEGASIALGGTHSAAAELKSGYFIDPTVFTGVKHGMTIEREEIFGPVMSVVQWTDEATMLEEVNDSEFGLCANIWTNDISTAMRFADDIECAYVWINGHGNKRFKGAPFGGMKSSGLGKEHSLDELLSFVQEKNVNVRY
ncbi:aldehyde dehydrogenase family protein [Rhizobium sp. P32RR-XVIII]|uniref:aldehyde dehydrogenase family protein n=1 Tax=Rhizobium sp. P32RR-XVIII TaxID=2726738 RepID=UPI001456DBEB|nr:aldehyde dehydrogenase family protein [Rhizobium sp. P32RR-XVIII]NLS03803.1 aldehyde dehydrogenase family protein [Rhizobium sp. P32RR-XVIII]